tara:strand:+ start:1085 stop:2056 length:972 start_codon:yes stop_codon:yes gene_type:complete
MELTLVQAVNDALREEMKRDQRVVVLGEDVGKYGGVFKATDGLQAVFGNERVIDTPLNEQAIVGASIGMSLKGLVPVAEIQFIDFIHPAFDQIVSELSKMRYRSGGQYAPHVVIRAPFGAGTKGGPYHSQSSESYFVHTAGLKVVIPSSPAECKGLLTSSIRDTDPVIFMESKRLYRSVREEVPEGEYLVPLGKARNARPGKDVTILTYGSMVQVSMKAAEVMCEEDVDVEVIDIRTLMPLDIETVVASAKKTGRIVIVHEAPKTMGFGAEISALLSEKAFDYLKAPIIRVTGYDTPVPFSLEDQYSPSPERVIAAIRNTMAY